jgi:uncharacterized DUF497 family protein
MRKHKITFLEAVESFSDPNGFVMVDEKHSKSEERFYWIGKVSSGKVLTTRFTKRSDKIRIIGPAECREYRKIYNEKAKIK